MRKKTHEEYVNEVGKIHPNIEVVEEYINANTNILHRCRLDGYEWYVKPGHILHGQGCPKCAGVIKKTHEEYITELSKINLNIEVADQYINARTKILHRCKIDGHEWYATPNNILRGEGCPICYRYKKKTRVKLHSPSNTVESKYSLKKAKAQEEFMKKMRSLHPNIDVLGEYINSTTGILCQCRICGFKKYVDGKLWTPIPGNLLKGRGCPVCSGKVLLQGVNDLATVRPDLASEWVLSLDHQGLTPKDVMPSVKEHVLWRCSRCGHEWPATINSRNRNGTTGSGCPKCRSEWHTSFAEQAILFYCDKYFATESRKMVCGYEIDVWIPQLQIGIEYNGSYFHKKRQLHDEQKLSSLQSNGIRVIVVQDGDDNTVNNDVITYIYQNNKSNNLNWAIVELCKLLNCNNIDINIDRDMQAIFSQYIECSKSNSFSYNYPDKAQEWDYDKNGSITPEMVLAKSHKKFWRICPTCKTSYLIQIDQWSQTIGCKNCSQGSGRGDSCIHAKSVLLLDQNGETIQQFGSATSASQFLNISLKHLCGRHLKTHKLPKTNKYSDCYIWYLEDYNNTTK